MTTTPRTGAPEMATSQSGKEETHNEGLRYVEQGAHHFVFKDRDLSDPPVSPADGDCYLVKATGTGAWAGHDGDIAFYLSSAWAFIEVLEGMSAYVADEDVFLLRSASVWNETNFTEQWAPNFTSDSDLYIPALRAMTVDQGNAKIGTGTITFEKSTSGAPSTFSSTTLPATLQAGAWLKVIATGVSGFVATHLKRTA